MLKRGVLLAALWSVFVFTGCAPKLKKIQIGDAVQQDLIVLTAKAGDTLQSLALKHYGSQEEAWRIAQFNEIDSVQVGDELIVPLKTRTTAGVTATRYQTVAVLSYHKFSSKKKDALTVRQADFQAQMAFLKENSYHVVSLDRFYDFLDHKASLPPRSVVITIDDSWRTTYTIAYPILKKFGYTATLFINPDSVTNSKKTMSWGMLEEMLAAGFDVQNHTRFHRDLTKLKEGETFVEFFRSIDNEIVNSERKIKKKLGVKPKYLAYPYGKVNPLVIAVLKKHGYRGGLTVVRGSNPFFIDNYRVNRSMIYGAYSLKMFEKNLKALSTRGLK